MRKSTITALAVCGALAVPATAGAQAPPRNPRARVLSGEVELAERTLFGGTVNAVVEAANVDATVPAIVNGAASDALADLHFEVQLRYATATTLGGRNAGEFVPHQKVTVRIVNTSTTDPDDLVEFDLVPHVGAAEGWHYASNVALPPAASTDDPFNDTYRVTVSMTPAAEVRLHSDAQPPHTLFRAAEPTVIFDGDVLFGAITTLPVTDVATQLARAQANADIVAALGTDDFAGALATFDAQLRGPATSREDPAGYAAARGLTSAQLADVVDNVDLALRREAIGGDCKLGDGTVVGSECKEWAKKALERVFFLSILHELDEALEAAEAGELAGDGAAHKWDEAWAYYRALESTVGKRETNCTSGRFGAVEACAIDAPIEAALLDGANAIFAAGGSGLEDAADEIARLLVQTYYFGVVHEVTAMREKINAGGASRDADFNKARVEGIAFFRTIAWLVPASDEAAIAAALTDRDPASFDIDDAKALVTRLNSALRPLLGDAALADPEVIP